MAIGLMFDPFAAHAEKVEKSHFIDEFGGVVRVKQYVLAQFAFIKILSNKPIIISRSILTPIIRFIDFHTFRIFFIIKRYSEIYLFRKDIIDLFSIIIDYIKVVIFSSLTSINHMEMLDL